jgi:hypothetical protein
MLPGAFSFTHAGHAGHELAQGGEDLMQKRLLAPGLPAAIVFLPHFVKRLHQPGEQSKTPRENKIIDGKIIEIWQHWRPAQH